MSKSKKAPGGELSETRAADRAEMASQVLQLCRKYSVRAKLEENFLGNKHAVAVRIEDRSGLAATVDFDKTSIQPNVFVVSWHFEKHNKYEILKSFCGDRNEFHKRKATDVARGFDNLLVILDDRLRKIANGKALTSHFERVAFSQAMWGYLLQLYDLSNGGEVPRPMLENGEAWSVLPVADGYISVGERSTYGFVQPWPEVDSHSSDPEDRLVSDFQRKSGSGANERYYVAMSEGTRNGRPLLSSGIIATPMYPERLFVWGRDEFDNPLSMHRLMEILKDVGIHSGADFWDACLVWRGYSKGYPTFRHALRGHTDRGPQWWDASQKLRGSLPAGYSWEETYGVKEDGMLYVDRDVDKEVSE